MRARRKVAADPLYDVYEVADYLKCNPAKVRALIASGKLESLRVGTSIRITLSALHAYLTGADKPKAKAAKTRKTARPVMPTDNVLSLCDAWDRIRNKHVG